MGGKSWNGGVQEHNFLELLEAECRYLDLMVDEPGLGGFSQGGQILPARLLQNKTFNLIHLIRKCPIQNTESLAL
jgi:predicted esterase